MKKLLTCIMLLYAMDAGAQLPTQDPYPDAPAAAFNINRYGFYIDSIRTSNEQPVSFAATGNNVTPAQAISLAGTSSGMHQLYAKVTNTNGNPSVINLGNFYMEGDNFYQNAPAAAFNINRYGFYIDSIRPSNEQTVSFAATGNNVTPVQAISLTGTTSGMHQLYAKVTNTNGNPSVINLGNFYMEGDNFYQNAPAAAFNINRYGFYVDSIRASNEQPISFAAANNNVTPAQVINLTGTTSGMHQLYAKVINTNGNPSVINLGNFYMEGDNFYQNTAPVAANINRYEFYIDSISTANIQPLSFAATTNNVITNSPVYLTNVLPGVHQLYARVFDVANKPSIVNFGSFSMSQIFAYADASAVAPALSNMEYYIDTDPGYGSGTPITVPGNSGNIALSNMALPISNALTNGTHYFHIRSKQNPWSIDNAFTFQVTSVLPVTWLYTKAQLKNNVAEVSWATATEINTARYEIEFSTNGSVFSKVGEVAAAGNSTGTINYLFTHTTPINGFNYYRIKQVDIGGVYRYSIIVTVLKTDKLTTTVIAPNPVRDVLHVAEPKERFVAIAEVYNDGGELVLRKTIQNKVQVYSIPVQQLPAAAYTLKVMYDNEIKTYRFVKTN